MNSQPAAEVNITAVQSVSDSRTVSHQVGEKVFDTTFL